jgi:AcrR family transcriptional regulator
MAPAVRVESRWLTARGERTRSRLVAAGEETFGRHGYHGASIAEITQTAGVAQGTFYLYFESKRELMRAIVEERGNGLRSALSQATAGVQGRVAKERAGFAAFFEWMARHRALYRIVRQSEYVDGDLHRGWYRQFADGYVSALGAAIADGEIAGVEDVETLVYALMGIGEFVGMRWLTFDERRSVPPRALATVAEILDRALAAESAAPPRRTP